MPDLLIHSMSEFRELILACFGIAQVRDIVEIGAEFGGMSAVLAQWAMEQSGRLMSIDPSPHPVFLDWVANTPSVRHVAHPSLRAIPLTPGADAWLVDGDHNWYTVFHELQAIEANCLAHSKSPLIFLHDVGWPCALRDSYYAPDRIPPEYRHPCSFDSGVVLGSAQLQPGRGFRGMGSFAWATHEGGPRNGVLTAVADFCRTASPRRPRLQWHRIPGVFGLGVLYDAGAPWAEAMEASLSPFHDNPLMERLEQNRLANYLHVLQLQDERAGSA